MVESKIKSVRIAKGNVTSVLVDRGPHDIKPHEVYGDLYIDCTGQQRVLSGSLSKWNPFDTILTDSALVVKTEYTNRKKQMVPYTNAKGLTSGWEWTIPTYDFISRGYVFSERAWTGNCVSIGLSYGFIEPLESTSLFNTHHGILGLMDILMVEKLPGQFARDRFNHDLAEHMDGWREFVEAHYYYSTRRDTPFWRAVTDEVEYKQEGTHEAVRHMMVSGDPIPSGHMPIAFILAGSGFTNINKRHYEYFGYPITVSEKTVDMWYTNWEARKKLAGTLPTMYEFLSGTFNYEGG